MILDILVLLLGIAVLVKSSSITIDKAARLSYLSGISQMVIGFIFIAVATSLPEFSIGVISSFEGTGLLSVGNLVGANVSNLMLVFGAMALIGFNLGKKFVTQIEKGIFITTMIAVFLIVLGGANATFGIFCIVIFYLFAKNVMKKGVVSDTEKPISKTWVIFVTSLQLIIAIGVVVISAYVVTNSSIKIADFFSVSESVIGASILAIGTTLPELSVSVAAVRKKNISLAVGNVIGSIVTNLALILGVVALINPFTLEPGIYPALFMLIAVNVIFFFITKRSKFDISEGLILLSVYIIYLIILFSGIW